MGRRRRRIYKPVKKTIPKIFGCPRCGSLSVKINKITNQDNQYTFRVVCGNDKCNLSDNITTSHTLDIIDIYNAFVDHFNKKMIG